MIPTPCNRDSTNDRTKNEDEEMCHLPFEILPCQDGSKTVVNKDEGKYFRNVKILTIMSVFFTLFVVAQIIAAIASHSISLLGDASAMGVDVFTYLCNIYAEWRKAKGEALTQRDKLMLEIVIPSFSVMALLGITAYILTEATEVLLDQDEAGREEVNLAYLFGFGAANILVDGLSCYLFLCPQARYGSIFLTCRGQRMSLLSMAPPAPVPAPVPVTGPAHVSVSAPATTSAPVVVATQPALSADVSAGVGAEDDIKKYLDIECLATEEEEEDEGENVPTTQDIVGNWHIAAPATAAASATASATATGACARIMEATTNLNMVAAFTHLCADTVRTSSLLITAIISTATGARPDLCDAWAAVVVSICIVVFTIPLIRDIVTTLRQSRMQAASSSRSVK